MEQPKKEPSQTMIYVSNLPFTTTDEQLRDLFKGYEIKTAYIAKRRNGRSKGFGFVNLVKESQQNEAITKVDQKEIDGRKITAKIAFNDPRRNDQGELKEEFKTSLPKQGATSDTVVYVANIPWTFKDEDLKNVFTGLDVKLATVATRRNGRSKGFGFVEFGTKEACEEALKKDQLKVLSSDPTPQERIITVRASHNYRGNQPKENNNQQGGNNNRQQGGNNNRGRQGSRGRSRNNNRRPTGNNNQQQDNRNPPRKLENTLYVSNIPFDLDDNDLKQIFSEFHVKSSHVATRQNGKSRGFGFVEFNNAKDQQEALNALNQSEVNNRVITVRVATGQRTTRDNSRGGSRDNNNRGGNRGGNNNRGGNSGNNNRSGNSGNNNRGGNNNNRENRSNTPQEPREPSTTMVYVSNLPFSVDDNELSGIFKGLKITNGYVSKRRNGASRGYGFVTFASQEEQTKALKFNGTDIKGRPIVVQVANKPTTPTTTTTPQN